MNRPSLGRCAAAAVVLALAYLAVAQETPAARVDGWLASLVAGDTDPLDRALLGGLLPERVARRYHPNLAIQKTDPEGFRTGLADGLAATLSEWADTFRGGRYAVLSTEVFSSTETAVVARVQNDRERQYLRFIFQEQDGQRVLADIRLPLLGTDLESMMVDAVTNRPGPQARKAAIDLLVWAARALSSAMLVLGVVWVARYGKAGRGWSRPAGLALLCALAGLLGLFALSSAPPRVSPEEQDIWLRRERIALIMSCLAQKDYAEAERLAREFLGRWPEHPRGTLLLAHALFRQNEYAEAEPLYQRMTQRGLYPELAHQQLARIDEARGDHHGAAVHLAAVVRGIGPDPALLVELANDQLLAGDVAAASGTLSQTLQQEPGNLLAREMRARTALRLEDPAAAAADLTELRRRDAHLSPETLRADPEFGRLADDARFGEIFSASP